jgi:hypothetical protein
MLLVANIIKLKLDCSGKNWLLLENEKATAHVEPCNDDV